MMELKEIAAANITALRKESNMTQTELAERLHYTDKAVSKWERGESLPDVVTLKAVADLFGVTVDYLLEAEHTDRRTSGGKRKNRSIITALSVTLVWLLATLAFVCGTLADTAVTGLWMSFVYAVPLSAVVLLVFNAVWGKPKWTYVAVSILIWGLLVSLYLTFLSFVGNNIWLIFVIGVPAQILVLLWSGLKLRKE